MPQSRVFIISGTKGGGKTSLVGEVCNLLIDGGITIKGFLSLADRTNNKNISYTLHSFLNSYSRILAQKDEVENWKKLGGFFFNPRTIKDAYGYVFQQNYKPRLYIIDEIGRLDVEGEIWHDMFSRLLRETETPIVITARDIFVEQIISYWKLDNVKTFVAGKSGAAEVYSNILDVL